MYGYICPYCGDHLDPGERCECREEKKETYCVQCGKPSYDGNALYTVDGEICEDCLECL